MDEAAAAGKQANATAARAQDELPPPKQGALVEEAARVAATLNDKLPMLSGETPARSGNHKAAPEQERAREVQERAPTGTREEDDAPFGTDAPQSFEREGSVAESAAAIASTDAPQGETRRPVGRRAVAAVGASVGENLRPRVEKLREASTGVLDEAADDPGLRFVIVAALLFLIFLFIFLFSYILG
jgi:hypothetical protein